VFWIAKTEKCQAKMRSFEWEFGCVCAATRVTKWQKTKKGDWNLLG
jgi:hypothetical protein